MAQFNQELYDTYNRLKRKGGVTDYSADISKSSYDQRRFMQELPNNLVVMPENVAREFSRIYEKTQNERREIPFFMYGHDCRDIGDGNAVVIDHIVFAKDNEYSGNEIADYRDLQGNFNKRVQENKNDPSFAVFIGHTHPRKYGDSDNMYSIQDLASVAYLAEASGVQFGACVVTPDRQVNMCFYDTREKDFYKINNMQKIQEKKDAVVILPPKRNTIR